MHKRACIFIFYFYNVIHRAISLDATNPVFYCNRAAAYSRLNDYQRAADDCKMSLRYDPTYSKAYGRMGIAYSKLNKHNLALEAYQNALRLDPDNVDYQNNMSVTQQRLEGMSKLSNIFSQLEFNKTKIIVLLL